MNYKKFVEITAFFGCLCSLFVCALLAVHLPKPEPVQEGMILTEAIPGKFGADGEAMPYDAFTKKTIDEDFGFEINAHLFTQPEPEQSDAILELYRQVKTRELVIAFFSGICRSPEIAESILANADAFNISPALAFALVWEESRFNPLAINNRNKNATVDRGLFQLNSRSFPYLELPAFFDPQENAYHGLSHLRYCLDTGGSEIAALAMYNAGTERVSNTGTPKATLDYVSRVLANRIKIENNFYQLDSIFQELLRDDIETESETAIENAIEIAKEEPERPRLAALLRPMGIR